MEMEQVPIELIHGEGRISHRAEIRDW